MRRTQTLKAGVLGFALGFGGGAAAQDFTAGKVALEMEAGEQFSFVAGMIEGMAHARLRADGNASDGMACIYAWFYEDESAYDNILAAFVRFEDRTPGAVLDALIQRRCGA
ncbi:hypothetical protein SLH49_12965 [Cognatiyoonia sp. IB215446]|uniref:hypothetical protein n=1 Tax=Cognatiyoonia sp. IB215446 TaxID=3097355 RepID=UPI002A16820D|nr:hypothetical protein [Cognatiyoonia sp. IB215446]MDX8348890.1 hypothetical protein [Cognatiyoonia sp. IB215446]